MLNTVCVCVCVCVCDYVNFCTLLLDGRSGNVRYNTVPFCTYLPTKRIFCLEKKLKFSVGVFLPSFPFLFMQSFTTLLILIKI